MGKKASPAKKAPKNDPPATQKPKRLAARRKATRIREGNTTLERLRRPGAATAAELMTTSGWQARSVRGFLSGTIRKKMGLTVMSSKNEHGERNYSVNA